MGYGRSIGAKQDATEIHRVILAASRHIINAHHAEILTEDQNGNRNQMPVRNDFDRMQNDRSK